MMGAHHAACGSAAWVAIASDYEVPVEAVTEPLRESHSWLAWLPDAVPIGAQLIDFGGGTHGAVISGAILMAGAALLPDADHHNATIAHSLPPISKIFARFVETISGGHRHGTHSIVGILVFTAVAYLLGLASIETEVLGTVHIGAGLLTVMLSAFAFKVLKFVPDTASKAPWIAGTAFGAFATMTFPAGAHWLALVVGLGCLIHILGDFITTEGVNWFWPATISPPKPVSALPFSDQVWRDNGYTSIPMLGTVSSVRAHLIGGLISAVAIAGIVLAVIGVSTQGAEAFADAGVAGLLPQ